MVGIVYITGFRDVANDVLADYSARLVAEGVDAGAVVHVLGVIIDEIRMDLIVLHTYRIAIPAPTQGYARIGDIVDGVVFDGDAADVACCDGHAAPVVVGDVAELRLFNSQPVAYFSRVCWLVGQMSL